MELTADFDDLSKSSDSPNGGSGPVAEVMIFRRVRTQHDCCCMRKDTALKCCEEASRPGKPRRGIDANAQVTDLAIIRFNYASVSVGKAVQRTVVFKRPV